MLLYNNCGKKVISKKTNSKVETIDLSIFSSGLYFYKLIDRGNNVNVGKLIKLD